MVAVLMVVDGQQQQQMRTGGWSWVDDDGLVIRVSQEEVEEHEEVQGWCRAVVMEVRRRWWR